MPKKKAAATSRKQAPRAAATTREATPPKASSDKERCVWPAADPLMLAYHDDEWGTPLHDDRKWFEFLVLDAFQAGLSWRTVLHKREAFRQVFHDFVPVKVARMSEAALAKAGENAGIIRNRQKIAATVTNAKAFLELQKAHGSFDAYIWGFTGGEVVHNAWRSHKEVPASTPLSDQVSKALKQAGFSFVGSTICYAFLQAAGIVNDHLVGCYRHPELSRSTRARKP